VRRRPRQAYAFGFIDQWSRLASLAPGLANLATQTPGLRALAKFAVNVPHARPLPPFAPETFEHWFKARGSERTGAPKVVLFADTFNNHFFPRTAKAVVHVLENAGYDVVVPDGHQCCGRPLYDYGFLDQAKRYAERVMFALRPHLEAGRQVVVLEPSCASVFRDEVQNLWPDRREAEALGKHTKLLAEFLREVDHEPPHLDRQAIIQGHCHRDLVLVAALVPERAGLIVADGFSCREQISQETDRHGLHLAEVIEIALHSGRRGPQGDHPAERQLVLEHRRAVRRSMAMTVLTLAGAAGALAVIWRARRRSRDA